ncbi:MAG: hypothetical protein FJ224_01140 [Lentisphaerae bacterium]|nr:hypothetical protein [Lentisphaerota bacterium]
MKFMTVREFRLNTGGARKTLEKDEDLVLTSNGRPFAVVSRVHADSLDKELSAMQRARARVAIDRLRDAARADGSDGITMDEIDGIVQGVRQKKVRA